MFAFGSLACFDSELVSPRLLKGSREGFCPAVFALLPSDLRPEGRDNEAVSVRDLVGRGPGCWFCSDVVDAGETRLSIADFSFLCRPVTRSNRDRFGSRPLGERCAIPLSRLWALCTLGEGLVARLRKFNAELMVEPERRGLARFAMFSRLVADLSGNPNPPETFSSLLRLCRCPGRCNLWPAMEGLWERLLLCSVCCEELFPVASCPNCQRLLPGAINAFMPHFLT